LWNKVLRRNLHRQQVYAALQGHDEKTLSDLISGGFGLGGPEALNVVMEELKLEK
jgi:hypothetical protein